MIRETVKKLPGGTRMRPAHIRKGLQTSTEGIRVPGDERDFNEGVQEAYLYHGLGVPALAEKLAVGGLSEHFSGVNAGTMLGDGIYFAEDIGKSDQYCKTMTAKESNELHL